MVREPMEIIAHRGASWKAPENTLAAFRLAWAEGADGIEGDFRLTRDGRVVCLHDARPRGTDLEVSRATLAELQALDVGGWKGARWAGERIPALEAVLALVPAGRRLLIEVKSGPEILGPLREALQGAPVPPRSLAIISFHAGVVAGAGALLPDIVRYWILDRRGLAGLSFAPAEIIARLEDLGAGGLSVQAGRWLDAGFVRPLIESGIKLNTWTVDAPETARRLIAAGIPSITTNRPGLIRRQLSSPGPGAPA